VARIRSIAPGFFANEDLASLHPMARLLFAGLWTLADREGRLEDRPRRIQAQLFPYESADVDGFLADLARTGQVLRYAVDGSRYLQVVNFEKFQRPHSREEPSVIPAPGRARARIPRKQAEYQHPPRQCPSTTLAVPEHDLGDAEALPRARAYGLRTTDYGLRTTESVSDETLVPPPAPPVLAVVPDGGDEPPPSAEGRRMAREGRLLDDAKAAWALYMAEGRHRGALFTRDRRSRYAARRREGHSAEDCLAAVRGIRHSAWHCGENPSHKPYDDWEVIFKNARNVESFAALDRSAAPSLGPDDEIAVEMGGLRITVGQVRAAAAAMQAGGSAPNPDADPVGAVAWGHAAAMARWAG